MHHEVNTIERMHVHQVNICTRYINAPGKYMLVHQVKVSGNVPETVPEECATTCSLGLLMVLMKTLMMTMKVHTL